MSKRKPTCRFHAAADHEEGSQECLESLESELEQLRAALRSLPERDATARLAKAERALNESQEAAYALYARAEQMAALARELAGLVEEAAEWSDDCAESCDGYGWHQSAAVDRERAAKLRAALARAECKHEYNDHPGTGARCLYCNAPEPK